MKRQYLTVVTLIVVLTASAALAHDTWLQTNSAIIRVGDVIFVDLMLGNHGNNHRDFKMAGKPDLKGSTWTLIDPNGAATDLKPEATDEGLSSNEGYYTVKVFPDKAGLYLAAQSSDDVASYAPVRTVRSAKTFFLVSKSLDKPSPDVPGFDRVLGHPLELVPQNNPIAPMGVGTAIKVKLLYKGKPLAGETVSFIPRGQTLASGFDSTYDRKTDKDGLASFEPKDADYYLIAARHNEAEKGAGYDSIQYSATVTVIVPKICPCCG